ncbi:DUF3047 domain-containing protein [Oceanimonas doudoroffii]|uniref:DUF3047 domain-containing protein n=1 Tax=Oceanimonas doudoroffii TaxID=84158 RepID=A0A233RDC9_9GAMM|nr:DUF3047 domain-containing protein [Oceanimonas doudoroffii]OXY81407.1 hypothetical protein B6S08_13060 [Oceanimonas doudoroffii]
MRPRLFAILLSLLVAIPAQALTFTPADMLGWKQKRFEGSTAYRLAPDAGLGRQVLRAESRGAASGLFYEGRIDLQATPWLSWQWRVERFSGTANERGKAGDDFALRVYVVVRDGWTRLSSKAISYVWTREVAAGRHWPNPFTGDKAMMLALRQGTDPGWVREKRNLRDDLRRLFGKDFRYLEAVAIMTDADNGGGTAIGYYGELVFSAD